MNRKVLLGSLAGLAVLVVLAALAVPFLVPTATLRAEIERRVSQQTGRALRIGGALNFTLFPSLGLAAHTVTLANAPWGHAAALLRVDEMQIAVKVLPLLHGRFEVDRIVLDKPAIALEVARDGSANWKLISTERGSARIGPPPNTVLAGIVVQDGALSYDNDKLGVHRAIDALDANVSVTRLDAPAGAQGTFMFRGRRLAYTLTLKTVQSLFAGRRTQADVALVSDLVTAGFSGQVTRDGTVDGAISLHTGSLKEVAAWLGHAISAGHGLGALDVKATIKAKDRSLSIGLDAARLDGMTAHGTLAADLAGAVPDVTGTLAFDRLDLNTYLGAPAGPPGPAAPRAPGPAPMQSGWSRAPVNLNLLKLLDGRVTLSTDSLSVLHLKTGKTTILATLAGGAMTAHLGPMQLYGGTGQADLAVDARGSVPLVANRLTFTGIAMAPFLADTIGVDKIDGRGTIALDIVSKGASPDAIMRALSGKGAVGIGPGSVRGVDMGAVARSVATLLSAGATAGGAETRFDRFSGSFAISNGILANNDLKMTSSFINMTGRGHLDLGNQTIVFRIEPKASLGGRLHLLDIGVPFAITGSWRHLTYTPDVAGAVTGLVGAVLNTGTAPIEGLLGGLLGQPSDAPAPADKKKKKKTIGDTLGSMFGLH